MVDSVDAEKGVTGLQDEPDLRVSFTSPNGEAQLGDVISLLMVLHNEGDLSVAFLPVNTAFEAPLRADVFDVTLLGEPVPYIGLMARRLPVVVEDVIELEPDERLEQTVVLTEYYQMNRPGTYEVRYVPRQLVIGPELEIELAEVVVDTPVVYVTVR